MNLLQLSGNELLKSNITFSSNQLIKPHENSRYTTDYEILQLENTSINTPDNIDFFWDPGDIQLPALNKQQLDYFKTYFKVIPQQRTENLKDGFYSKELE